VDSDAIGEIEIIDLIGGAVLSPGSCSRGKDEADNEGKSFHEGSKCRLVLSLNPELLSFLRISWGGKSGFAIVHRPRFRGSRRQEY
jgi:hypothetical protein